MAINPNSDPSTLDIAPESMGQVSRGTLGPGEQRVASAGPIGGLTEFPGSGDEDEVVPHPTAQPGTDEYDRTPPSEGKAAVGQQIAQVWKARGWSDAAIHGGLANALDESNLSNSSTGSAGEWGIFQFNPSSHLGPYREFAQSIGANPANPRVQADYVGDWVDKHMPGYGQSTDPHSATDAFMTGFERPADQTPGRRWAHLAEAQQLYGGGFQTPEGLADAARRGQPIAGAFPSNLESAQASPLTQKVIRAAWNSQPIPPREANSIGPFKDLPSAVAAKPSGSNFMLSQGRSGEYFWQPINPDTGGGGTPMSLNPMQSPIGNADSETRQQLQLNAQNTTTGENLLGHGLWNILGPEAMASGLSTVLGMGHDLPAFAGSAASALHSLFGGYSPSGFTDPSPPKNELNPHYGSLIPGPDELLPGAASILPFIHSAAHTLGVPDDWMRNYSTNSWDKATDFAGNFLWSSILGGAASRLQGGAQELPKVGPAIWSALKSIGAGLGLGEVNDGLDAMDPNMHPFWHSMALMATGTGWNLARMGAATAAEKAVTGGSKVVKSITSTTPSTLDHADPFLEQGARTAIADTLAQHAHDTLKEAAETVNRLGVPVASEGGMSSSEAAQARADLDLRANQETKRALQSMRTRANGTEKQLWSIVPHDPRDYSGFQGTFNSLMAGEKGVPGALKEDFPFDLKNEILGQPEPIRSVGQLMDPSGMMAPSLAASLKGGLTPTPGLRTLDSLQAGRDMLDNLNQRISTAAADPTPNGRLLGHLSDLKTALLSDMGRGTSSPQLILAKAFSREFGDLMASPEMRKAMNGGPNDMSALRSFLVAGPKGASGVEALHKLAFERYGASSLVPAYMDMIRRTYADRVAPNGLVDSAAHAQFMGPSGFGAALAHPEMGSLREELNGIGESGRMLDKFADPNTPAGLPTSYKQRAAAMENWLGQPVDTALQYMFKGRNPAANTQTVLDRLAKDPTGKATSGMQALIGQKAVNEAGGIGQPLANWMSQPTNAAVLSKFFAQDPSFADRFNFMANPTGSKLFLETMAKIPGAWLMARVGNVLAEGGGFGSSMLLAGRFAKLSDIATTRLFHGTIAKVTGATIADPERFAQWQKGLNVMGAARSFRTWGSQLLTETASPWMKYVPGIVGTGGDPDNPDPRGTEWYRANGLEGPMGNPRGPAQ